MLALRLCEALAQTYGASRPFPERWAAPEPVPAIGRGSTEAGAIWDYIVDGSAKLAAAGMLGHMDTAPHPFAALTDGLVSALNNNLLFRELSPFASEVETLLINDFAHRVGWPEHGGGLFCSGGSLANLTALFAAVGGYGEAVDRSQVCLVFADGRHGSIPKAARILGLSDAQCIGVAGDDEGRIDVDALRDVLKQKKHRHAVVVAVAGTTVHGAIDPLEEVAKVARQYDAWLHVDAVYGGAVLYSDRHRGLLNGIEMADSIALGPQKWLQVPRLSAAVLFRDRHHFDTRLGYDLPYSQTGATHLGFWGLQGSRRADAVTLWALLQVLGSRGMGDVVDRGIAHAQALHACLDAHPDLVPLHRPELNLLCFRPRAAGASDDAIQAACRAMMNSGGPWVSPARWMGRIVMRAVLLNARLDEADITGLAAAAARAWAGVGQRRGN